MVARLDQDSGDRANPGDAAPTAREDVVFRPLEDDWVLFDPVAHKLHILNLTAALVWTHCDGSMDPEGLAEAVASSFQDSPPEDQVRTQVAEALEQFRSEGLLQ